MLPKSHRQSTNFLENWLLELCDRAEVVRLSAARGLSTDAGDIPSVYQLVKTGVDADMPNASHDTKRKKIASELFDQMSGGREVLGLVLAYTIYYISQSPSAQERLRTELATLEPSMRQGPDASIGHCQNSADAPRLPAPSSLDKLPYLSAILKESFRMRPTSTPLPRVTPRDRCVSLAGVDGIPPNTRVNVFQWFIHRNPENYNNADEWYPERWLEAESKSGKSPLLWPFGGGSRMCVGVSLTQYLMRYILALIYSNFSSRVVSKRIGAHEPGSTEDEILVQFEPLYCKE
ncbi:hypothetical protein HIM_05245 [Hirsutella minnesotensis 3608]|uniref:Cytochrome P450 n=1 Tax=Hirsutella minnesotensis 3608 TaxID=1043627 RepID=A0A0F8A5H1_9HYPO|nr:hypothetical protein HIM_05245 [Hirsutella minnesotensis 3608]